MVLLRFVFIASAVASESLAAVGMVERTAIPDARPINESDLVAEGTVLSVTSGNDLLETDAFANFMEGAIGDKYVRDQGFASQVVVTKVKLLDVLSSGGERVGQTVDIYSERGRLHPRPKDVGATVMIAVDHYAHRNMGPIAPFSEQAVAFVPQDALPAHHLYFRGEYIRGEYDVGLPLGPTPLGCVDGVRVGSASYLIELSFKQTPESPVNLTLSEVEQDAVSEAAFKNMTLDEFNESMFTPLYSVKAEGLPLTAQNFFTWRGRLGCEDVLTWETFKKQLVAEIAVKAQ